MGYEFPVIIPSIGFSLYSRVGSRRWALLLHLEPSITISNPSCSLLFSRFIEQGEYKGNYYGTSFDSVRSVLSKNKVCLLDVQPHVSLSDPQIHILPHHFTSLCVTPFFSISSRFIFPPFHRCDIPHYSYWIFSEISVGWVVGVCVCIFVSLHSSFWSSVKVGDLTLSLLIVPHLKISSGLVSGWESSSRERNG